MHIPEGEAARERPRLGPRGLLAAGWRALLITALLGCVPFLILALARLPSSSVLFDFRGGLYNAGRDIIHGLSPYQPGFLAHQAAIMRAGGQAVGETANNPFSIPVYPAPANLAVVPLSLLPFWLAATLYTALSIAAMILGLQLLGVRDWRCIALALISWPFTYGLYLGALGPFLVLGAAIAWHWRARLWPPAIAIALLVITKVFPWPLGIWLLITRRFRTLAIAIAIAAVLTFAAWAAIGFHGLAQYPQMLSNLSFIQEGRAVSLVAVLIAIGLPASAASAVAIAAAAALLGYAWRVAKRPDRDRTAFGLAIIAALTATPIVWEHYMVLLFVPIALITPRLSAIWFLPLCTPLITVTWAAIEPINGNVQVGNPDTLRSAVLWLLLESVVLLGLCWHDSELQTLRARLRFRSPSSTAAASLKRA
jgi:Glycosyltransferase family 87